MARVQTWQELAEIFRARGGALRSAWRKGTREATRRLWVESRKLMEQLIYAHRPDTYTHRKARTKRAARRGRQYELKAIKSFSLRGGRKGGKGWKWEQTGNLKRSESQMIQDAYTGIVRNAAPYAHARHNLALSPGDPEMIPPAPKKRRKSTRVAPWRARAIVNTREQRLDAYRGHLIAALRRTRG